MNRITYENQGNNTYLVYEIAENDVIDNLSLGMINNNRIPGLASVIYTQLDDHKFLKYNITAKVPASTFLGGTVTKNRMLGVFSGVSKALLSAEEYMLDANSILLDLDYIFVDVSNCEAELICLPVQMERNNDVVTFFKNIVFSATYDQTENSDYVAKIISCLNNHSSFSLSNFMQTIDELNGKRINLQELQNSQQLPPIQSQIVNTEILPDGRETSETGRTQQVNIMDNQTGVPPVKNIPAGNSGMNQSVMPEYGQVGGGMSSGQIPVDGMNTVQQETPPMPGGMPPTGKKVKIGKEKPPKPGKKEVKKDRVAPPPQNWRVPGAPPIGPGGMPPISGERPPQPPIPGGRPPQPPIPGKNPPQPTVYGQQPPMNVKPPKEKKQGFFSKLFGKKPEQQPPMQGRPPMPGGVPPIPGGRPPIPGGMPPMPGGVPPMPGGRPPIPGGMPPMPGNNPPIPGGVPPMPGNNPPQPGNSPTGGMNQSGNQGVYTPPQPSQTQQPLQTQQTPVYRYMNFGETTVLGGDTVTGETSVLSVSQEVKPYLVRKKTGQKVTIEGPVFKIGKEHNYVDYFIADNSAISRSHANIVVKGNDYFIVDTNSKNHTYVNGQMIPSNVETPLTHGSMVKLANEEFEFRMY